jgi:hypothetical protein
MLHSGHQLEAFPTYFWQTLFFLNFSTLVIYSYLIRSGSGTFVQMYLLTMGLKLVAYFGYNLLTILRDQENAEINVGFFMITYLMFTMLELIFLYRRIGR